MLYMAKKNYMVTGGLGLIGSAIVNSLTDPTTIVTRSTRRMDRLKRKDVKIIVKNINDLTLEDLKGIDIIYHCASKPTNYNVLSDPYIDIQTDLVGTVHILELCKNLKKKPLFIYFSTFFVYGHTYDNTKTPINEESKTDPLAIYPATKLCAESIVRLYGKLHQMPYLICRLTNVYGELEDYNNSQKGALNLLIMKAIKGEELKIYNNGNFYRDYIHVDDVVSAVRFLEEKQQYDTLYLIGYGKPILFSELIHTIKELTHTTSEIHAVEPPPFHKVVGMNNFVADTSKINRLGWKPKVTPKEGIEKIVKQYKDLLTKDVE